MNERQKKWLGILLHIAGWALFLSFPYLLRPGPPRVMDHAGGGNYEIFVHKIMVPSSAWANYLFLFHSAILIPFFYLNLYLLFPKLLKQKHYAVFIVSQASIIFLLYCFQLLVESLMHDDMHGPAFFMLLLSYLFVASVSFGVFAMQEQARMERVQKTRENEALRTELQFLRWQISPHFLFNVLNNMVALARVKSDKLEPMLINMSELMRYMLYEADERKISLQKEATYVQSYINLQSLRYDHHVQLHTDIEVPEETPYSIESMLLIPFVENAFKHGIGMIDDPHIFVHLSVENGQLNFQVRNKYTPDPNYIQDDAKGVGLANVQRRLNLLYEGRYKLRTEINDWYTVFLTINLAEEYAPLHNS
jgi:hypothetical protein